MNRLLEAPSEERGLEELASQCGASGRTLARLFRKETGMTFVAWRKQLRLLEAIDLLGQGHSISQVAFEMGYQSTSAFIAMFHRTIGATPGRYMASRKPGRSVGSPS
jgi:AraC-like DNA-binding protein